jgi:hypothetical protein
MKNDSDRTDSPMSPSTFTIFFKKKVSGGRKTNIARRVDSSVLVFSLSSHRYSFISLLFSSRFIDS